MSKYLLKTVETYRVDTESAAEQLVLEAKKDNNFTLVKHLVEYKEQKAKGEVIDTWYRVTLTKQFTEEKEPIVTATVSYATTFTGNFPNVDEEDED